MSPGYDRRTVLNLPHDLVSYSQQSVGPFRTSFRFYGNIARGYNAGKNTFGGAIATRPGTVDGSGSFTTMESSHLVGKRENTCENTCRAKIGKYVPPTYLTHWAVWV